MKSLLLGKERVKVLCLPDLLSSKLEVLALFGFLRTIELVKEAAPEEGFVRASPTLGEGMFLTLRMQLGVGEEQVGMETSSTSEATLWIS